jgi:NADH-quinone oxidoreductase subunit J
MDLTVVAFYVFACVAVAAGLFVVLARNPVHSVLWLILAFFSAAGLMVLLGAEFLAIILIIVYVGAVMVLFLFVVMMLDINVEAVRRGLDRYAPLGIAVALLMAFELVQLIWLRSAGGIGAGKFAPYPEDYNNTKALGSVLYTEHVYAFEIAAVILLLAIVAAITLTMRKRPGLKIQNIASQVAVRSKDRIRVVKMDAEKKR